MDIRRDDPVNPALADLLRLHLAESRAATPADNAYALDGAGLSAPGICFWTAWDGGSLAGIAAMKDLGDGQAEIKSMRTAPAHLRRGVARAMLVHLAISAREAGFHRLNLETGTAPLFEPAVALYRSFGFVDCAPYGDYRPSPHNRFMTLAL